MSKSVLLVDGPNLYSTVKNLGFDVDYRKLLKYFQELEYNELATAYYFTAILEHTNDGYSSLRPLLDFLDYNGWTLVTKMAKEFKTDDGRTKIKGNLDVEIVLTAINACRFAETIYLASGDGDFTALAKECQRRGVRFVAISTLKTTPPMIADELRRACDLFIDVESIREHIHADATERTTRLRPRARASE